MTINHFDRDNPNLWRVRRYNPLTSNKNDHDFTDAEWIPIYVPATPCKIERSNIVGSSSGRDESGYMHIDWVRGDVRKVYLHYNAITGRELEYMQNLLQGKQFLFTFLQDRTTTTIDAYASEASYENYSNALGDRIYKDYEIHVIEL